MKLHSLSIFSFDDGNNKYCVRIVSCTGMFLLAALIFWIANYFVNISWLWNWSRVFWGKYYQNEQNIDSIFLGSSHVFCGISPEVMDKELGGNHWNMSNNGMRLNGAYSILQEVNNKNDLKNVYLELFWWCSTNEQGETNSSESYFYNAMNTDHRTENPYNLELQLTMSSPARYLETFFPGIRYRQYLLQPYHIKRAVQYQLCEMYKRNIFRKETSRGITEYRDKGVWYSTIEMLDEERIGEKDRNVSNGMALTESAEKYLRMIIEYCRRNEINIILFCSPMYDIKLLSAGDYDAYVNDVRSIAAEYEIPYYDFNLVKSEYLDIQHLIYYKDRDHLNTKGAVYFSRFFAEIIKNPDISRDMFYNSYKEKLADSEPEVYGLYWQRLKNGAKKFYVAANRQEGITYNILVKTSMREPYRINVDDLEHSFIIDNQSSGEIELSFRMENTDESGKYIIKYYK